jgi:energy-coupling factor transporter ATP-binding protein EcfA2
MKLHFDLPLLQKLNNTGKTVILATHDREIINKLGKRVITLEDGKIILSRKVIINGLQSETISLPKGVSGGLFLVKISDIKGKNYYSEKIIVQ